MAVKRVVGIRAYTCSAAVWGWTASLDVLPAPEQSARRRSALTSSLTSPMTSPTWRRRSPRRHLYSHLLRRIPSPAETQPPPLPTTPCLIKRETPNSRRGTLSNLNPFLKCFHWQVLWEICNKVITKNPTTPCICCHTTLWNYLAPEIAKFTKWVTKQLAWKTESVM